MRLARSASKMSTHAIYHVGAVIVRKRPVSVGANLAKSHPVYADGKRWYTIHAEMKALLSANQDVEGCSIFVYREGADGTAALAKPCDNCMQMLVEAGIKTVYFTVYNGIRKINL